MFAEVLGFFHPELHVAKEDDFLGCELRLWFCLYWLNVAKFLFALDEVAADLATFFVTFNHRKLFGCVEGEVVFLAVVTASTFCFPNLGSNHIVLIFNETIFSNTFCYPRCKAFTNPKESV
ncbi:hypothetical protein HmCmsJML099_02529 [Escherichia coli]|nr:hypothetical protein HmCmsJML099_02529 [Escherichia coli]